MNIQEINDWKDSLNDSKKIKNYQHIDDPLDIDNKDISLKVVYNLQNFKQYQFLPFIKRVDKKTKVRKDYLSRKNIKIRIETKPRPIMYASHMDALIYSYFGFLLQEKYFDYLKINNLDSCVIAYRKIEIDDSGKGKSNIHFAKEVFDYIKSRDNCVVITQDIKSFFDNLDHKKLKDCLIKVLNVNMLDNNWFKVYESITKYKYIKRDDLLDIRKNILERKGYIYEILKDTYKVNTSGKGIPQGSPMSGVLANIYLANFDLNIKNNFPEVFYRRYSDDLVLVCDIDQVQLILNKVKEFINNEKLEIQDRKTFIAEFNKNTDTHNCIIVKNGKGDEERRRYVDYLGFEFDGKRILLRKRTVQSLKNKHKKDRIRREKNRETPKNKKSKKLIEKLKNGNRLNYFSRSSKILQQKELNKQISHTLKK